jgi:hypothetical protein
MAMAKFGYALCLQFLSVVTRLFFFLPLVPDFCLFKGGLDYELENSIIFLGSTNLDGNSRWNSG